MTLVETCMMLARAEFEPPARAPGASAVHALAELLAAEPQWQDDDDHCEVINHQ